MRYERKYRIEASNVDRVKHEVLANPVGFFSSYPDRWVNSIYYDDINFSAYNDNLLGIGNRLKYRVRWYGEELWEINKPILEKKIKKNMLGAKEYAALEDFSLREGAPDINQIFPEPSNHLFPHIIVRYRRSYYESMDRNIRATIDQQLQYINLIDGKLVDQLNVEDAIILEIKYDQGNEKLADHCLQMLPYRVTKNSKYVSAMKFYLM